MSSKDIVRFKKLLKKLTNDPTTTKEVNLIILDKYIEYPDHCTFYCDACNKITVESDYGTTCRMCESTFCEKHITSVNHGWTNIDYVCDNCLEKKCQVCGENRFEYIDEDYIDGYYGHEDEYDEETIKRLCYKCCKKSINIKGAKK